MSAPERIWVTPDGRAVDRLRASLPSGAGSVEYVRADIHEAVSAQVEIALLEVVLAQADEALALRQTTGIENARLQAAVHELEAMVSAGDADRQGLVIEHIAALAQARREAREEALREAAAIAAALPDMDDDSLEWNYHVDGASVSGAEGIIAARIRALIGKPADPDPIETMRQEDS